LVSRFYIRVPGKCPCNVHLLNVFIHWIMSGDLNFCQTIGTSRLKFYSSLIFCVFVVIRKILMTIIIALVSSSIWWIIFLDSSKCHAVNLRASLLTMQGHYMSLCEYTCQYCEITMNCLIF